MEKIFTEKERITWMVIFSFTFGYFTLSLFTNILYGFAMLLIIGTACITCSGILWIVENILKIKVER